ncbi:S8 family serine peptidase [Phenylobacterium sp. LjRoot219]|uniref:S8 family serine peptidase n=1 Tax=Phenylobacterium sp. LjRoot219 TaxID=3342283 RepID=UPI003ED0780A
MRELRRLAAERLIREHPDVVEADDRGAPVVRGRVLTLSPSPEALAAAAKAGFLSGPRITEPELGLESVALIAPKGMAAREAVRRLRALDPEGRYDLDHIYQEGGSVSGALRDRPAAVPGGIRVGLVDGSVATDHPSFNGVQLTQRAFAPGGARVTAHATAVASLLAGSQGAFRGSAPGAMVLVADVYGPTPAGGSAQAIVSGLAWLAQNKVGVINISLVGPPNLVLAAAIRGLVSRGALIVAAVGNDGPAAPPLYPAAYPGVVAVTGVDARNQVLPEAGRGAHVAFAAPGAQMAAAAPSGGFTTVRGTSFAAPLVAGALAADLPAPDPARAAAALRHLSARAQDLGARGRDPVFGQGLVANDLRVDPLRVNARAVALRGP